MKLTGYIKTITKNGTTTCTLEGDQVYVDGSAEKQNRHNLFWDGLEVHSQKIGDEYDVNSNLVDFVISAYTFNRKVEVDVVGADAANANASQSGDGQNAGGNNSNPTLKIQSIKLL